jgi:putative aldouronate transport system substrate-binding protein
LVDSLTYINSDWLRAVNRPMPTTVTEFADTLRAFRNQNVGNPGGPSAVIPLNFCNAVWNAGIQFLSGPWGIQGNFNLINGRIIPTMNTPEYRQYLEWAHMLVSEGLVNIEGFTQNREMYASQISSMNVGVFMGWAPTVFIMNRDHMLMWDVVPILAVPGRENLRTMHGGSMARANSNRNGWIVSRTSRNWQAALRWWDYIASDQDRAMLVAHGPEGIGYRKLGPNNYEQIQPTDEQARSFGLTASGDFFPSIGLINSHPVILRYPTINYRTDPFNENAWRARHIPQMAQWIPNETLPRALVPSERIEQRALIEVDLFPFITQFRAEAIMNGVTDATWNAYVRDLDARFRYTEWLRWQQDFVDGRF